MAFRIKKKESVGFALKRVLREQIEKAERELALRETANVQDGIHQARKRCKKIRALYRLLRSVYPGIYKRENKRFRDAARDLSRLRDAEAMIETYDKLMARFDHEIEDRSRFANIRRQLTLRRNQIAEEEVDLEAKREAFSNALAAAKEALDDWSVADVGFDEIGSGAGKTYHRGRKAMGKAFAKPKPKRFHEWRKRVKYYRFHVRFLRGLWKAQFVPMERELNVLGELLGDDHDLAVLKKLMQEDQVSFGKKTDVNGFFEYIELRQNELREKARRSGELLFAMKRKTLWGCYRSYWETWRSNTQSQVTE